jgi:hypothetical protein
MSLLFFAIDHLDIRHDI